ncbi:MAG: mitofilin family membrane protein [Pseudomonadota bacterium]
MTTPKDPKKGATPSSGGPKAPDAKSTPPAGDKAAETPRPFAEMSGVNDAIAKERGTATPPPPKAAAKPAPKAETKSAAKAEAKPAAKPAAPAKPTPSAASKPVPTAAPKPAPTPTPPPAPSRGPGLVTTGIVALIAGGLGGVFGAPYVQPLLAPEGAPTLETLEGRVSTLETAEPPAPVAAADPELQTQVEALAAEVTALSGAPTVDLATLEERIGTLEQASEVTAGGDGAAAALGALTARLEALETAEPEVSAETLAEVVARIEALETAEPEVTGDTVDAVAARVEALETAEPDVTGAEVAGIASRVETLESAPEAATAEALGALDARLSAMESQLAEASARADQAEALLAEARAEAQVLARKVDIAAAAETLSGQLTAGEPFADTLATLTELAQAEAPAGLTAAAGGVATTEALAEAFDPLAQRALRAEIAAEAEEGALGQATAWFQSQVVARPAGAREGEDTASRLSRIAALLEDGDAVTALAEADMLADAPREALGGWLEDLRLRAVAEADLAVWLADIGTETRG